MIQIDKISSLQITKIPHKESTKTSFLTRRTQLSGEKAAKKYGRQQQHLNDNPTCKQSLCIDGGDKYKVECKDCQRLFHYKCSQLPLYQLQLFLTTGYHKFVCINCVNVPKYLEDMVPAQSPSQTKTMAELTIALKKTSKEIDNHKVANQAPPTHTA